MFLTCVFLLNWQASVLVGVECSAGQVRKVCEEL